MRKLNYCDALNEALYQEMERDPSVFVYGIGVPDHKRIFGTTNRLLERFGPRRCFDTPVSEEAMTGIGLGAALNGLRPVHVHIRVDFLLLAMNQLANVVSSFRYGTAGKLGAPMVIRAVVGRGWGQGFQHSKSLHGTFAHFPGLKVVMPTTPHDAKGMLIAAIRDDDPVLMIEHRWLYWQEGPVPAEPYCSPLDQARVLRPGNDISLLCTSWLNVEAIHAAQILARRGVSVEVVDVRSAYPLDVATLAGSVDKTGLAIVADNDWVHCGLGAEIAATLSERCWNALKQPMRRIGFPHTPCPTARNLENEFYPNAATIVRTVETMLGLEPVDLSGEKFYSHENRFRGPF